MRHAGVTRIALLSLAIAVASGCRCTACAPSAVAERTAGAHRIRLEGQAAHEWGVDGFGAPHVGGVIWPTVKGAGYAIHMIVDDRPKLFVAADGKMPSKDELTRRVAALEVVSSPDDKHLGVRVDPAGNWRVVHLMPRGVPFESAQSDAGKEIAWDRYPPPEQIAMTEMREERCRPEKECGLLWSAVESQAPGAPIDDVLLEVWPAAERSRAIAVARAQPSANASPAWRRAAGDKALGALQASETRRSAFDLLIALEDPQALASLDRRLLELWKQEGEEDSHQAFTMLESRLSPEPKKKRGPPMATPERALVVAAARELIRKQKRTRDCGELIVLAGGPEDAAWMDEILLEVWPYNAEICLLCDGSQEILDKRVGGWGPPVKPEWRERATDKAAQVASKHEFTAKACRLLLAIDTDRAVAAALDRWIEVWPEDTSEHHFMMPAVKRAPASWKPRAAAKANACVDQFASVVDAHKDRLWSINDDDRWKATYCIELLVAIEGETMSCERWREVARLDEVARTIGKGPEMPARCSADAAR